mgnify:FL=1
MVQLTAEDNINGSGVAKTYLSTDRVNWHEGTTISIETNGQHTVYFYSVDVAGNVEETQWVEFKIDRTAPVTSVVLDPAVADGENGWYKSPVKLTFTVSDEGGSGVAETSYSRDGTSYTTGLSVVIDTDGEHTIWYRSTDGAGNAEEPKSVSFKIDQTKPEWNAEGVSAVRTLGSILELDLAARASDATSGVASVSATLNGVPWDGSATVLTQPGNNILVVTVKDYAGNVYTTGELNIPVHYVFSGFEDYTRVIKRGSRSSPFFSVKTPPVTGM